RPGGPARSFRRLGQRWPPMPRRETLPLRLSARQRSVGSYAIPSHKMAKSEGRAPGRVEIADKGMLPDLSTRPHAHRLAPVTLLGSYYTPKPPRVLLTRTGNQPTSLPAALPA